MGYFLAAVAAIIGSFFVWDAWMMSLRTETIHQDIYVMIRMAAGMIVFMLGCILWTISLIAEMLKKSGEAAKAQPGPSSVSSPASASAAVAEPAVAAQVAAQPEWGARSPSREGWICSQCGKENSPGLPICRCGTARA